MCSAIKIAIILHITLLVSSDYQHESRKAKLFSFNKVDEDIKIDLDFSIPFVSIPIKKTMDAAFGDSALSSFGLPTININPASLALGGAVVLGTTVLVPFFLKSYAFHGPQERYSRVLQAADFETSNMLDLAQMLLESRNLRGCVLKVACWTGQMTISADAMKTWGGILSNRLLSSIINSTSVEDAMLSGKHGRECATYKPCPLKEIQMLQVINGIAGFLKPGSQP